MLDLQEIEARCEKARAEVSALCKGRQRGGRDWTMHIPVKADDSDVVLSDSLRDVPRLIKEVRELRAENERVVRMLKTVHDFSQEEDYALMDTALRTFLGSLAGEKQEEVGS